MDSQTVITQWTTTQDRGTFKTSNCTDLSKTKAPSSLLWFSDLDKTKALSSLLSFWFLCPGLLLLQNSLHRSTDSPESTNASSRQPPPGWVKVALGSLPCCGSLSHFHHALSLAQHPGTRRLHSQPSLALEGETSSQRTQITGLALLREGACGYSFMGKCVSCHKLLLKMLDTKPTSTFPHECLSKHRSERYTTCWPHRFRGFWDCQHLED